MERAFSPYQRKSKFSFHAPQGLKKGLMIVGGVLLALFLAVYLMLGDLRFFANNFLRLTFLPRHYLIVLQNNYESRPGGGFITAYGKLDTFFGFITNLTFHNSYDIDTDSYITPPYPQEDFLKNEWYQGYTFRDANWEADFRKNAPELIKFYQDKFPESDVDGIAVINFSAIESMLETLGDIQLGNQTLNASNLFAKLEYEVNNIDRHSEESLEGRKDVLSELAPVLMSKLKWHPLKAKEIVLNALQNKDIYLWFASEGLENKMVTRDWGNTLTMPAQSDFLAVNVANLGSKKADRYVKKEVHMFINLTKELPEITTEVTLRYPGFGNSLKDNYKGYLRLYIPKNAVISTIPVDTRQSEEEDFRVLGTKLLIPTGSKTSVSYTYTLPRTLLADSEYHLRLIKQSGSDMAYSITVETPPDTLISSSDFVSRENQATFEGHLTKDRDLGLTILPDTTPPYAIEQVFEDPGTISIYWSEPIQKSSASDPGNFKVVDLDKIIPAVKDDVIVTTAEVIDESVSRLKISGITDQPLERYQVTVYKIKDQTGNATEPDPKILTAVQRYPKKAEAPKTEKVVPEPIAE